MTRAKKVMNYRPMLFIACALMAGIALCLFAINSTRIFWWVFFILVAISILLLGVKKFKIAIIVLAFIVGFGGHYLQYKTSVKQFNESEAYFIEARVAEINTYSGYSYISLDKMSVDTFKVKGKATLRVDGHCPYEVNQIISFYGYISNNEININNIRTLTNYGNRFFYNFTVITVKDVVKGKPGLFYILKERMTLPMDGHLTQSNKGIAYSLLFGDSGKLNVEDSTSIRATGLSHIFAVSGLHISFIVAMIALLLRKLKLNRLLSTALTAVILFLYCGITGFPPSALRASLMAIIYLLSLSFYKKTDPLSALSLAAVIILLISPITFFSLSFIMSVSAVFGIILFYKPINAFLMGKSDNKFRKFVAGSISLSISANTFLLPLCINVFGTVSIYLIVANLLILPLVTITYAYLFAASVLSAIFPGLGFLFLIINYIIEVIRIIAVNLSLLPYAVLSASNLGVFTLSYILIMAIMSRFVLISKYNKLACIVALTVAGVFLTIIL